MARSTHTGDGSRRRFPVGFPFLDRSHVFVTVNNVGMPFAWISDLEIELTLAAPNGAAVVVQRMTPDNVDFADIKDTTLLTAEQFKRLRLQLLFLIQERSLALGNVAGAINNAVTNFNTLDSLGQQIRDALAALTGDLQTLDDLTNRVPLLENLALQTRQQLLDEINDKDAKILALKQRADVLEAQTGDFGAQVTNEAIARITADSSLAAKIDFVGASRQGASLNLDPNLTSFDDFWVLSSGVKPTKASGSTPNRNAFRATGQSWFYEKTAIPVSATSTYRVSARLRQQAGGNRRAYIAILLYDAAGNSISVPGKGGAWSYYPINDVQPGSSWVDYSRTFGAGQDDTLPANVAEMRVGVVLMFGGTAGGWMEVEQVRLEDGNLSQAVRDLNASIATVDLARVNGDTALAQRITTLEASVNTGTNEQVLALINQEASARASADQAQSERIDTVQAAVTGQGQTLGTVQTSVNTLATRTGTVESQWVLKVQSRVDGKQVFAGIGVASSASSTSTQSEIIMQADRLVVVPGSNLSATPTPIFAAGQVNGVNTFVFNSSQIGDRTVGANVLVDGILQARHINANSITADKIDTRGLTVKDAAGNVIFGSGTNLDWGRITGQPGGIYNSNISLNANGTLNGAGGGQVTLPGLGQSVFRVLAVGNSATTGPSGSLGLYKDGAHVSSVGRSYVVTVIDRATRNVLSNNVYDVYGDPGAAAVMAAALNALSSNVVVVVRTHDEPQNSRLNSGLDAAMYRCGASKAVFGSANFRVRAAYVLIGIPGCGEGNGAESYQGKIDNDPNAWVDVSFAIVNGSIVGVSQSYTPTSLQDYGYTGDLNAESNSKIGINASGQLYGVGAGNGIVVSNNQISITGDGKLMNGGTQQGQMTTLPVVDTRNDNIPPSWYPVGVTSEFKRSSALGVPSSEVYGALKTEKGWNDPSGGSVTQTFKAADGEWKRVSTPGSFASWGPWLQILDRPFTQASWDNFMTSAFIRSAHIQSLSANKVSVTNGLSDISGNVGLLRTASSGGRMELEANRQRIFDGNGNVRVIVGYLL